MCVYVNVCLVCIYVCLYLVSVLQHYHHFGDLLKMALARCREAQPIQWYKTIALSLQQVFLRLSEEGGGKVDLTDPQWVELRDLARRYSLPFSFDQFKATSRQMLVGIHRSVPSIITHKCTLMHTRTHTQTHTYTQCLVFTSAMHCERAERCGMRVRVCSRSSKLRVAYLELRTTLRYVQRPDRSAR